VVITFTVVPFSLSKQQQPHPKQPFQKQPRMTQPWESLDSRPLPQWYSDAKIGIFILWGVLSVPAYGDAWFWRRWKDDQSAPYVNYVKATEVRHFAYPD
jgi:hypothetical protein